MTAAPARDGAAEARGGMRPHAVIVDDCFTARSMLRLLLGSVGAGRGPDGGNVAGDAFEVIECADGDAALAAATGLEDGAVILASIDVPGCCGAVLVRRLRAAAPGARLIAVAGIGSADHAELIAAGADCVIRRPLNPGAVHDALAA